MTLRATDCGLFTGYKPCRPGYLCEGCGERRPITHSTLVINLDNLGNVIQMTSLLPAIRRAMPDTHLTWVTDPIAVPVFAHNPRVDRVMPYGPETLSILGEMRFDLVLNVDKSMRAAALANTVRAGAKRGFGLNPHGAVEPFNQAADYSYRLGLDDELKFRVNDKPGTRIATEMFELEWRRDPYSLELSEEERAFVAEYRGANGLEGRYTVALNTGSNPQFPNKSMSVAQQAELLRRLAGAMPDARLALVGGRHETEKNERIAAEAGVPVLLTPTAEGVRRGLLYIAAADAIVTGDTSGLHMGVALGKWVVAFFGVTCASEIDLYDRGVKIVCDLDCSPCWRPSCPDPKCIRELDLDRLVEGVLAGKAKTSCANAC